MIGFSQKFWLRRDDFAFIQIRSFFDHTAIVVGGFVCADSSPRPGPRYERLEVELSKTTVFGMRMIQREDQARSQSA
jgi:hypothetical protein